MFKIFETFDVSQRSNTLVHGSRLAISTMTDNMAWGIELSILV